MSNFTINIDSKAIKKLITVTADGVGAVCGAWLTRRNARAEADAKLILTQAEQDARAIASGEKVLDQDGNPVEVSSNEGVPTEKTEASLVIETDARLEYQEQKRQHNLMNIFHKAIENMPDDVSDEKVDPDWIARFFTYGQDVTSEEVQEYWSRMLANEVATPGSFSLRTMDILRNLSGDEITLFENIKPYIWVDFIPVDGKEYLEQKGYDFANIQNLCEAGLLDMGFGLRKLFLNQATESHLSFIRLNSERALVATNETPHEQFTLGAYLLTASAIEILSVLDEVEPDQGFIKKVCSEYTEKDYLFSEALVDENFQVRKFDTSKPINTD